MNSAAKRMIAIAITALGLTCAADAQAVNVTFRVRMAYQVVLGNFDPESEFVDVAGTFNDWGSNPLTPLADTDGDTIYEVTVGGFAPSEEIEYKFRLNGEWDGREEFPGVGNNRFYTVPASDDTILVWYNDYEPNGGTGELHWWNDRVFYEVFVRSFYDSDGDGIGDLQGLTQKLDYLNDGDPSTHDDLGITGIWLMPINKASSYHGYDATDYRSIDPDYGTMADFQAFLAAAHARGIKVIVDFVMNHCSDEHPWFVAATQDDPDYRDYFRWSGSDPGQTGPWGQDVWHWNHSGWYYGLFGGGMPDLNYENQAVKDEMFDTATYWLDTVGVDGFRLDAVLYIIEDGDQLQNTSETLDFWHDFNTHVKAVREDALSVGEAWTSSSVARQYVTDDRLDLCFEFDLAYAALDAVNWEDADALGDKEDSVYRSYPYLQYATFLTNHDQDRTMSVLGENEEKARLAAGIYLTLPGVPFVYYGEEIGMTGTGSDINSRTPMQWTPGGDAGFTTGSPWQPINGNYAQRNVATESGDPSSLLNWYRRLIGVRNEAPALRRGSFERLASSDSAVLAFVRSYEQETVLCLANTSPGAMSGVTVTSLSGSLDPGEHTLVNLIAPGDTLEITVTPDHEIAGLDLDGREVAAYEFAETTGVDSGDEDPSGTGLRLEQSYPNPFNPSTTVRYSLPGRARVTLRVYDVAGREVAALQDGSQTAGPHEVRWNGLDDEGRSLSAGTYFLRLRAGGETRTSKMVLLK
jgi:alpha-amylase